MEACLRAPSFAEYNSPSPQKVGPLCKSYIHPWTTVLLRIYLMRCARRIHAGKQLIVCSTLYVYALQNLLTGQKMTKIAAQHILKCNT